MANPLSTCDLIPLEAKESVTLDADDDYDVLGSPDIEVDEIDEAAEGDGQAFILYSRVHDPPKGFKDPQQVMLIPGCSISVKIIDVERHTATHMIHPNLYVLQLQHGPYQWIVKRRYKHFLHLHQQLRLFKTALAIPLPTKKHKARRKSCRNIEKSQLPRFPKRPEALVPNDKIQYRANQLEEYIKNVLRIPLYRTHHEM